MLIYVGTGVGISKVNRKAEVEHYTSPCQSGTSATNTLRLITGIQDYNTLMDMAKRGDRFKCDMNASDFVPQLKDNKHEKDWVCTSLQKAT